MGQRLRLVVVAGVLLVDRVLGRDEAERVAGPGQVPGAPPLAKRP